MCCNILFPAVFVSLLVHAFSVNKSDCLVSMIPWCQQETHFILDLDVVLV
jgi:hypothetical protein